MDVGEGMVAMVRGLTDASLAVTLLDGTRKYTLMPNNAQLTNAPRSHIVRKQEHKHESAACGPPHALPRCGSPVRCDPGVHCESAAQATDGRYASVYKTAHCHVCPTSPAAQLTEFPPQRVAVSPGHDNFEVGGTGSGDTHSPTRYSCSYRGGMSWPDRGSVCEPRSTHGPDTFANSLRKYPGVSPERSTEVFERLYNYTQAKHAKNSTRNSISPSRVSVTNSSRTQKSACEHQFNCRTKKDESPTRDSRSTRKFSSEEAEFRKAVFRNYDVRYFKEVTKRTRDSIRNLPMQNTNSVNMETQAVVETASKEVATQPKADPSKRNVAVSVSAATFITKRNAEGEDRSSTRLYKNLRQTILNRHNISVGQVKSVQTSSSSIEFSKRDRIREQCSEDDRRKSKSEEELGKSICFGSNLNSLETPKVSFNRQNMSINNEDRSKFPLSLDKECIDSKSTNLFNNTQCYQTKDRSGITDSNLELVIKDWFNEVPINYGEYMGRPINKQNLFRAISIKLKQIILNANDESCLKSDIVKLIDNIPISICEGNRQALTNLTKKIFQSSVKIFKHNAYTHWKNRTNHSDDNYEKYKNSCPVLSRSNIQVTEADVNDFVSGVLNEFFDRSKSRICAQRLQNIKFELTDALMDSLAELRDGDDSIVKNELFIVLRDIGMISEYQAILLTDTLLGRFKTFIDVHDIKLNQYARPQTFVVLQNTTHSLPGSSKDNLEFSIKSISQRDLDALLDTYINQLCHEINSWLFKALGPEVSFIKEVAVNDLAGDILDRLKYLDNNPIKQGSEKEELEVMKFQIYKWINRLVGDDIAKQAIERAPELLERIRILPVPMLSLPKVNSQTDSNSIPPCCVTQSTLGSNQFHPNPWFKKQNISQPPTGISLPDQAMLNTSGQNRSPYPPRMPNPTSQVSYLNGQNITYSRPLSPLPLASAPMFLNSENVNVRGTQLNTSSFGVGPNMSAFREPIPSALNTVNRVTPHRANDNMNNMPVFGPAGHEGRMKEASRSRMYTHERLPTPYAFATDFNTQDVGQYTFNQIPLNNQTGQVFGVIPVLENQSVTGYIPPSSPILTSVPIYNNSKTDTPLYASLQPNLMTPMAREPLPSGDLVAGEAVQQLQKYNIDQMPLFGVAGAGGSMIGLGSSKQKVRKLSDPGASELETRARVPYQPAPIRSQRPVWNSGPRQNNLHNFQEVNQSMDQLNIQYDQFLKKWVEEIPLPTGTPKEQLAADTIRSKFYNGVWRVVLKVKLDPTKYTDRVYCQGVLDDAIQELFDLLPKTHELETKKNVLKLNLLQKTLDSISNILDKSRASNYKQLLVEQVLNHLPNRVKISSELWSERHEDLQIIQLVDSFILYARYREEDKIKANVYRKKLNDCVDDIFKSVKSNHKTALSNIDVEVYKYEVVNALHKVPLPTPSVLQEEADEILLGVEIEKWFSDLPIISSNDPEEQLERRRIRYAFAKQIRDIENQLNLADDSTIQQVKTAAKRFLLKLPMQSNQESNLDFITEEFANRLKNRAQDNIAQRPKSVSFEVPALFEDFAKNIPLSSSVAGVNLHITDADDRSLFHESNQGYADRLEQIPDGCEYSQTQKWYTMNPLSNDELALYLKQNVPGSPRLSQPLQLADGIITNPQQQLISGHQSHNASNVIQAPSVYLKAPEQVQTSFGEPMAIVQNRITTNAGALVGNQSVVDSRSPGQQRTNHVILDLPEASTSPRQIETQKQFGTVPQPPDPVVPIGILGTSQIAGSSGLPRRSRPAVTNKIVTAPDPQHVQAPPQVLPSPHNFNPQTQTCQPAPLNQIPAPNIPADRSSQNTPHQVVSAPPTGNFCMSNQLPVAYSTPQQSHPPLGAPPRLERKRPRGPEKNRDEARRRLDLEVTDESESDEVECRCMERTYRCRRRRHYYDHDDCNNMECPRYFPMRYPHPYFF